MLKAEKMDRYLESIRHKPSGQEVRRVVNEVFNIDLNHISEKNYGNKLSTYENYIMKTLRQSLNIASVSKELDAQIMGMTKNEVMDRYLEFQSYPLTGAEIRILINQIFGVNLDGISGLEHGRLSIYSKGQWIHHNETDLFLVSSSLDDVTIYVNTLEYFKKQTGSSDLPESLKKELIKIGFTKEPNSDIYSYTNVINESVTENFKSLVIGLVIKTIETECSNL